MGTYHQMGHDSWNLVEEVDGYAGLILSPVNQSPQEVRDRLARMKRPRTELEVVLDPQFYQPASGRGQLATWQHLGDDIDTADLANRSWWEQRCRILLQAASEVGSDAVCSPAILPRAYSDDYYLHTVVCADAMAVAAAGMRIDVLMTAIVSLAELAQENRPEHIASLLTASSLGRLYLVFNDGLYPRTNRTDQMALIGAAKLVRLLEGGGMKVLVAFSGLDVLIWKGVGASDVATGKFFNLRRFVPGRWEDAQEGGRNVPYWTDESLVAWLREDDLRLLDRRGLLDRAAASANPYSVEILSIIDAGEGKPWTAASWRQYLFWAQQVEAIIRRDPDQAIRMLEHADKHWMNLREARIDLRDRENTGEWIRVWKNAVTQSVA
jgi:hypothetical protein